jgi:sulfotransferase
MIKQIVGLAGLPRSGSTLLNAILSQNPAFHTEGTSPLLHIMYEMASIQFPEEQLRLARAINKTDMVQQIVRQIPNIYYSNATADIIIDKCRVWTHPENLNLMYRYFPNKPKVIVLERPVLDIVKSFMRLKQVDGSSMDITLMEQDLNQVRPLYGIMRAVDCLKQAKINNKGEFLFLTYDELVSDPETTLDDIYDFCGWQLYSHDFKCVINKAFEDDGVHNLINLHAVRPNVEKMIYNDISIPQSIVDRCESIDYYLNNNL